MNEIKLKHLILLMAFGVVFMNVEQAFSQVATKPIKKISIVTWVNPSTNKSNLKPPSVNELSKYVQECSKKGPMTFNGDGVPFWLCMAHKIGIGTWNANYKTIICNVDHIYAASKGKEPILCLDCYPTKNDPGKTPCSDSCTGSRHIQDCCDVYYVKCLIDGVISGKIMKLVTARCNQSNEYCDAGIPPDKAF